MTELVLKEDKFINLTSEESNIDCILVTKLVSKDDKSKELIFVEKTYISY